MQLQTNKYIGKILNASQGDFRTENIKTWQRN